MKAWGIPTLVSLLTVVFFAVFWWLLQDKTIAVLDPKGQIAEQQLQLIIFAVSLGMLVIIPVFVLLAVFAYKYRASNQDATYEPEQEGSRLLEYVWWGIPIVIIIILSVVTWVSTHKLDPYRALESDKKPLHVQVVALEWRWLFLYPEQGVASINELRIPADRPVEFSIGADAPMSAFWIPSLGSQTYAMNGMTSKLHLDATEEGTYRGANSNISGEGYSKMNFAVIATSDEQFDDWVVDTRDSSEQLDWNRYENVAEKSDDTSVHRFVLQEKTLYEKIIAKYMGHSHESSTTESQHDGGHH